MASVGEALWSTLIPPELADILASDEDGADGILIASDDAWIPWEILRPSAGALPLGARFRIGQWPAGCTPRGSLTRTGPAAPRLGPRNSELMERGRNTE